MISRGITRPATPMVISGPSSAGCGVGERGGTRRKQEGSSPRVAGWSGRTQSRAHTAVQPIPSPEGARRGRSARTA